MAKSNPAPAPAAAREPVTLTGVALLAAIAAAADGFLMLTQAEGQDIVAAGHAVVDPSIVDGETAAVRLTDAGRAVLAEQNAPAAASSASSYEIDDAVPLPTNTVRRTREGGYPFDKLEVGQSFHVAKTAENPDPASRLASSVSGARVKFSEVIPGEFETVTKKTYKKGADGKGYAKDENGKRIVESETEESQPKTRLLRDFVVKSVDASDPKGEGARVWRTA